MDVDDATSDMTLREAISWLDELIGELETRCDTLRESRKNAADDEEAE
jgi:hypothetical protein